LPGGVFLAQGPQLRLLLANHAATALWGAEWQLGQPQEKFLQQQGIHLFTATGRPLPLDDLTGRQAMTTGEPVLHRQLVIRQPDGTRLPVLVDAIPFENLSLLPRLPQEMAPGFPSAERVVLVVYQDVSALKEAEALKDQFISLATHELRTPVTIVSGYADRLLTRAARGSGHELDAWQREKVQEMKQASWHLASLTEDLLDVTRMQAGQFQLERRSTDLVALSLQVINQFQATTDRHQLAFQTDLSQLWATVDAIRIEQVLSNLLSNAIKYSPGGGSIEVTLEEHAETH
jgi:signal transduction histidine kinase